MKYLLDTNTCIRYMNGRSQSIVDHLHNHKRGEVVLCSIVKAELRYGAIKSDQPEKNLARQDRFMRLFSSLPFDDQAAEIYGRIRAVLTKAGTPIGGNDTLIAAIAVAHGLVLVTHNTREFNRVPGLVIEDWEENDR